MLEREQEIVDCKFCPFQEYTYNKTKELGFGNKYRIMFVGSSPSVTSNKSQGKSRFDFYLRDLLRKVDIEESDYYFTNLVKTSIPTGVIPTDEQLRHCMSHLVKEILDVKPQVIILFGKVTRDAFELKWPETFVSKTFTLGEKKFRTTIYPIQHPGILHYHPEQESKYLKSLTKAITKYKRILL